MKPLPEIRLHADNGRRSTRARCEKRVGLIILATDHTSEPDFRRMVASERIGVYVARIPYANPTTPENLRKMQPALTAGAALILPDETARRDLLFLHLGLGGDRRCRDRGGDPAGQARRAGGHAADGRRARAEGAGREEASASSPLTRSKPARPMAAYFAGAWLRDRQLHLPRLRGRPRDGAHCAGSARRPGARGDARRMPMRCSSPARRCAVRSRSPAWKQAIGRPVVTSNQATRLELPAALRRRDCPSRIRPADDAAAAARLTIMTTVTLSDIRAAARAHRRQDRAHADSAIPQPVRATAASPSISSSNTARPPAASSCAARRTPSLR